jgi:hypothetical protein
MEKYAYQHGEKWIFIARKGREVKMYAGGQGVKGPKKTGSLVIPSPWGRRCPEGADEGAAVPQQSIFPLALAFSLRKRGLGAT